MKCPADGTELKMADRQGIEIDYCPQCRGVWLDRGELDRIIERSASYTPYAGGGREPGFEERDRPRGYGEDPRIHDSDDQKYYERGHDPRYGKHRKRKSFLGDLFDFD
jgi:Zn-finger nucleic acid-binding protein